MVDISNGCNTTVKDGESFEDYIIRIGKLKLEGRLAETWENINIYLRKTFEGYDKGETWLRKTVKKLMFERAAAAASSEDAGESERGILEVFDAARMERIRARDERTSINRVWRERSRKEELLDLFEACIEKTEPIEVPKFEDSDLANAMLISLSDIHYGLAYDSYVGKYNSDIAKERVMHYADSIIEIANKNQCRTAYLCLMGDMISGNIHTTVRIENRENIVEQITGVSELVSEFIRKLAEHFEHIWVYTVPGNHSRIDANLDNTMRGERMDNLVTWYCETKLANLKHVSFESNNLDITVAVFPIGEKFYACVHGDMDMDPKVSAAKIAAQIRTPLYCLMLGHMHVASMQYEDMVYLRNGSVCGSGDEYTMKKRLFGAPVQVCAVVSNSGIKSIHPVTL